MFHVLTNYQGWGGTNGIVMVGRIYITEDSPAFSLFINDVPNVDEIRKYPALLVQEPQANSPQPARGAYIQSINRSGKHYNIEYIIDSTITPIPSDLLVELLATVGLSESRLNTSCWRVVNHNLFKLLLRNEQRTRLQPTVFNINAVNHPDHHLVSVMMPFNAAFNPVYVAIKEGVEAAGMMCQRADDIWINQHIIQDVVDLIARAEIVICDLSEKNSNVFYEAGIAHTMGKEIILIAQSINDVPFDLRALRCFTYLNNGEGLQRLKDELTKKILTCR